MGDFKHRFLPLAAAFLATSLFLGPIPADANSPASGPNLKLETYSEKVPPGTMLTIAFKSALDSRITQKGEPFLALLETDFFTKGQKNKRLVLPKGTIVRGRVSNIQRSSFLSKGGAIVLNFDHVVLPSGDLLPLDLNLSADHEMVKRVGSNKNLALYQDPGIGYKVNRGMIDGFDAFGDLANKGIDTGKEMGGTAGAIVAAPIAVIGGAVAGTAIATGKAAKGIFGKGQPVVIQPEDTVTIDFGGSFNIPAE